jgi:hypothetical protein
VPDAPAEPTGQQTPGSSAVAQVGRALLEIAYVVWPAVLVFAIYLRFGRLGYNPTDDGFVLAASQRLLHGAVPHADFVSARPIGSSIIHTVDILLPTRLEATSRIISIAESVAYTMLLAVIAFARWPRRWSLWHVLVTVIAVLINMHGFPIMPWHTIDGLLFCAAGFAAILVGADPPRQSRAIVGMLLLGFAALVKQSFFFAPLIGILLLLRAYPTPWRQRLGALWKPVVAGLAPGVLYGLWVAAAGGLSDMIDQLTGGQSTIGEQLFTVFSKPEDARHVMMRVFSVIVLLVLGRAALRLPSFWGILATIAARTGVTLLVVGSVRHQHLVMGGTWGDELVWILLAVVAWQLWADHELDVAGLVIGATAWMAMLSWGYPTPDMVAGSVALVVVVRVWRGVPALPNVVREIGFAVAVIATLVVLNGTYHDFRVLRDTQVYRDAAKPGLTKDLGSVTSELSGIRTSPNTYAYVDAVRGCLQRFPASRVALLPDNPGLYAIFDLRNPFPVDWSYYYEMVADAKARMIDAAHRLSDRGDYLVLFETIGHDAPDAAAQPPATSAQLGAPVFDYNGPLEKEVMDALHGQHIACGPFVGVYDDTRHASQR